ncbi:major facilitator superfamily domain-containing protein [Xylariales sp. PMI_506]|nr:major facilitator superfamily domain-containing protein [Xylariales sp. PMI_506]
MAVNNNAKLGAVEEVECSGRKHGSCGPVWESGPRDSMAPWKFKVMIPTIALLAISYGYDVGNTANIQASIYEAVGRIELLPWINLGLATGSVSVIPLWLKLSRILNLRLLLATGLLIFATGAAIAGAGQSMPVLIVGRVITGIGLSGVYQISLSYIAILATPLESPRLLGLIAAMFSMGLISGPLVGAAFAENTHATWRWSMYINLPIAGMLMAAVIFIYPSYTVSSQLTLRQHLHNMDWVGAVLHIALVILLVIALTCSGVIWAWNSAAVISIWVVWGIVAISYIMQQRFTLFTTRENRIFPFHLLSCRRGGLGLLALATCTAGSSYSVALYYLPLFYAFARGYGAIKAAIHLLPFICVFSVVALTAGALLPVVGRYFAFYVLGGAIILTAGALLSTSLATGAEVSDAAVMGYQALLGTGLGLMYFQGIPVSNAALPPSDRFHGAALINMAQLGSTSIGLAIAGCVYQNEGFSRVRDVLQPCGFVDEDAIRQGLAGLVSPLWTAGDNQLVKLAAAEIIKVMAKLFYIVVASGGVCLVVGLLMDKQRLNFRSVATAERVDKRGSIWTE